jgi:hypothetical protein
VPGLTADGAEAEKRNQWRLLMLDQKLLDILACPTCRNTVVPDEEHRWLYCNA